MRAYSIFVVTASCLQYGQGALFTEDPFKQQALWQNFKNDFERVYPSPEEEVYRFKVFVQNLKLIDNRNEKETGTAVHGINKFADVSPSEFKARYTNYIKPGDSRREGRPKAKSYVRPTNRTIPPPHWPTSNAHHQPRGRALSGSYYADWTDWLTTAVKDQGYCGDCWAFSVAEQVESDYMRDALSYGMGSPVLSPQQITSCTTYASPGSGGCNGGLIEYGFSYAMDGLETEASYPFTSGDTAVTGTCESDSSEFVVYVSDYYTVADGSTGDEEVMAAHVASYGPLSIAVDASEWSSYTSGILSTCGTSVDHAVQVVGVDTDNLWWKVRNSWGDSWGEAGYIYLSYGSDTCHLTDEAMYSDAYAM